MVVVIDVLRAFTAAAWAFHRGAAELVLTTTVDEAFRLRDRHQGSVIMGEVDALPVDGFDLPNSPTAVADATLRAQRVIHRTTAGTQGACRALAASHLYAASLVVANATPRPSPSSTPRRLRSLKRVAVTVTAVTKMPRAQTISKVY